MPMCATDSQNFASLPHLVSKEATVLQPQAHSRQLSHMLPPPSAHTQPPPMHLQ